jgi:hypothetical protein
MDNSLVVLRLIIQNYIDTNNNIYTLYPYNLKYAAILWQTYATIDHM